MLRHLMKLRPSRYTALTWKTHQQNSPLGTLVGAWIIAATLGLYFADDILLADTGEAHPYPVFVSIVGQNLSAWSEALHFSTLQKTSSDHIHELYESHLRIGDHYPPEPEIELEVVAPEPEVDQALSDTAGAAEPPPPSEPQLPKSVLIVGSSSMYSSMGVSLEKNLSTVPNLKVVRHAKPGTGLSRPDVYNWLEVSTDLAVEHKSDLVIAQFIGNDCQSLVTLDKEIEAQRQDDHWNDAYRSRVAAFIDAHQELGAEVVLIGMPIVRSNKFRKSLLNANQIVKEIAEEKGVLFISTWEKTADKSGRYTEELRLSNKTIKLRHDDGIHLSYKGAQYLAAYLFEQIKVRYPWDKESTAPPKDTPSQSPPTQVETHPTPTTDDSSVVSILEEKNEN